MTTSKTYQHGLYKGSKKWKCEGCGQRTAVVYVNHATGELFPEHVSRCDRESSCGYHYTPKMFYADTNQGKAWQTIQPAPVEPPRPVDFLLMDYLHQSIHQRHRGRNNFFLFLIGLFGERIAAYLFSKYLLCTSAHWKGAALFPQIDEAGRLRQVKIMLHNQLTGKRIKAGATVERFDKATRSYVTEITEKPCSIIYGRFISEQTKGLNLVQTFFGCHLLTEYPDKPVCIVESEKTAVIASVYLPQFIWLATGGASGCRWREYETYKVLRGRSVTFFPDHGYFNLKTGKTCFQDWTERCERISEALPGTRIRVSDVLEKRLAGQQRQDADLADLLLKRDEQTGLALTEDGYPVMWDYKI